MCIILFFFFTDTATTEIYTLSLHDALPIFRRGRRGQQRQAARRAPRRVPARPHRAVPGRGRHRFSRWSRGRRGRRGLRSEEHTSELQSRRDLVCRLLLEKKKKKINTKALYN